MTLRIGINLHNKARAGQDRSAAEKEYLPQFLRQLNPSAIVVMDDLPFAEAMHQTLQNTIVIYRQYSEAEGHMFKAVPSPADYVQRQRGLLKPGMPLYIMNEWDSKAPAAQLSDGAKWMAGVMDVLAGSGDVGVIDNEGAGHPDYTWFTDPVKWGAVKTLFDAFKRHPQMYWGLHPYWGSQGLRPEDGQSARHREIERLLKERGYSMPNVIFTEMGRDAYGGAKTNGWRSTGISEESYAAEILEARNTLWTEPYIRGACVYCYGSTTDRWQPFDIENAKVLHRALIAGNQTVPTTQPPYVIIPPNLTNGERFTIQFGSTLQAKASADISCKVGSLIPGETVTVYRKPSEVADGFIWHYYERFSTPVGESPCGWTSHLLPPPDPIILPPPPQPTAEAALKHIAALWQERQQLPAKHAAIDARQDEIDEELDTLTAIWLAVA